MENQFLPNSKRMTRQQLWLSQQTTKNVVNQIFQKFSTGMTQDEARKMALEVFKENDISRWHDIVIQFGINTNNGYYTRAENDNSITYNKNDVVYIDIGIIVNKTLEGDYGQTFYRGEDLRVIKMINMVQYFWEFGYNIWKQQVGRITGVQLYQEIAKEIAKHEYEFPIEKGSYGHPVGIFLHEGSRLALTDKPIKDGFWILEILIFNKEIQRGAFYEDALQLKDVDLNYQPKI